jgi:hypothetical protein
MAIFTELDSDGSKDGMHHLRRSTACSLPRSVASFRRKTLTVESRSAPANGNPLLPIAPNDQAHGQTEFLTHHREPAA